MMQDTMIVRVLRISPNQSELYRRNFSRIFLGFESESLIDTILQQPSRPVEDYIEAADRAIAFAGLDCGPGVLRPVYENQVGAYGASHLKTQEWLKDESGNVFDLFISLDTTIEPFGEPPAQIMPTSSIENALDGENPLCLTVDIEALMPSFDIDEEADQQISDDNSSGGPQGQGRVIQKNDGRLKENREAGVHVDDAKSQPAGSPAMARQPQEGEEPRRGRVRQPWDRRLRGNRGLQRRAQEGEDPNPPAGGSGSSSQSAAGGSGQKAQSRNASGGNTAELSTWDDGSPRTVSAFKKDGTPRRKPGPAIGSRYNKTAIAA